MDNRPVQLERNAAYEFYHKNRKVLNTLLMNILVFIIGEAILRFAVGAAPGTFLSVSQVFLTVRLAAFIALLGLGQMIVICVGGGLDLSVGYIATFAGILGARIMNGSDGGILPAVVTALAIGAVCGLCNGLLTAYVGLPALVVTMAMANIVQGMVNVYVSRIPIAGQAAPALKWLGAKFTGIIPNIVFVILLACIIMSVVMKKTRIGVSMIGVGANETAAFLSGVNVKRVRCVAFVVSGMIAALVGLLLIGYLGQAAKDIGSGYVMPSVVAVVVGGISIDGGEGNYPAVVLGAIVLQALTNLFVALGWGDAGKWLGYGIILLVMLAVYVRNKRTR